MLPSCSCRATVLAEALLTDNASASGVNDCRGGSQISSHPYTRPMVREQPLSSKNNPMRSTNSASSRDIRLHLVYSVQTKRSLRQPDGHPQAPQPGMIGSVTADGCVASCRMVWVAV